MPLFRYFVFVGCALVGLLFAMNWIWPAEPGGPSSQTASAESPLEQTIRIRSARRWPEKITFDTTQPTIMPPPAPAVAAAAPPPPPVVAASAPLDAHAELKPAAPPAKRQAKVRHRYSRPDSNPRPEGWRDPWHQQNTFAFASPMAPSWSFGRW